MPRYRVVIRYTVPMQALHRGTEPKVYDAGYTLDAQSPKAAETQAKGLFFETAIQSSVGWHRHIQSVDVVPSQGPLYHPRGLAPRILQARAA